MKRAFLLTAVLLSACAPAPATAPVAASAVFAAAKSTVTAVGRIGLHSDTGRRLLAGGDLTAWAASDVDRVVLSVRKDGVEVLPEMKLEGAAITQTVILNPLESGTTFTVVGRAYRSGVAIDNYAANAASCTTTFTTPAKGGTMQLGAIRIQFGSRAFAGSGGTDLGIVDGDISDAAATPDVTITP